MHELSIVSGIIDLAKKEMIKAEANKITSIEMQIGTLSGIEMKAFDFAWEVATKETPLENAKRIIDRVIALAKCLDCNTEFETSSLFETCPSCGGNVTIVIKGKEMKIKAITVDY